MITALIPAHNESDTIADTVQALQDQELPLDRIIVIVDNCTDDTEAKALKAGAETYITVNNKDMKAGGLNAALARFVLPSADDDDLVICIDADSIVGPNFTRQAAADLRHDPRLGGVSGTYHGKSGGKLVGWCQRNEFARWGFDNRMQGGRTVILSGAASVFRVRALRDVVSARQAGKLPGRDGVYCVDNITEDFELSLALRHIGWGIRNMLNVRIDTSVKPTWHELHTQRVRWDRGINEGLFQYGITRYTASVWFKRTVYAVFVPVSFLILAVLSYRAAAGTLFHINLFWIVISLIMMTQKCLTIRQGRGAGNALLAFLIFPELPYDTFLQVTFLRALYGQFAHKTKKWRLWQWRLSV
ncbi:MAG TPA: glycosyltransferase family 2 protein [Streptosporangiaceae bacterium]|nr:glycosyltransferase family 2 protein [Streptosporangiaceae bacterium]